MTSIYSDNLLEYAHGENRWVWDMEAIEEKEYSRNVVDLLSARIDLLPEETQYVLRRAACIGNRFDLKTLSVICEKQVPETLNLLRPCVVSGIVEFLDSGYKRVSVEEKANAGARFVHDRLQQAALAPLPGEQREKIHLAVGTLLLSEDREPDKNLFLIADQLNLGMRHLPEADKARAAELNLAAGKRAKSASAHDAASAYLENGLALLGEGGWEDHYPLTLALYTEAAESAYLNGNFDLLGEHSERVLEHARDLMERMKIYRVRMEALIARGKWPAVIEQITHVLKLLGIDLPAHGDADHALILQRLGEAEERIDGRPPESFADLPEMTDPAQLAAMELLTVGLPASFIAAPALFPVIVSEMIKLVVSGGNSPMSTMAYANYGIVLCAVTGDTALGYRYGRPALRMLDLLDADAYRARTVNNVNVFLGHWQNHLKETLKPLMHAYHSGLETGDLVFAGYSLNAHDYHSFFTGVPLEGLEREIADHGTELSRIGQEGTSLWNAIHHQVVRNLMNPEENRDPARLSGEAWDEEKMLPVHEQSGDMVGLFYIQLYRLILCLLFHEPRKAARHARAAEKYLAGAAGMPLVPIFHFYDALAQLACWPGIADEEERAGIRENVSEITAKLYQWSENGKENYRHKYYLLKAEQYRISEAHAESREYFDRAISLAREHGYINEEALANELAGRYYRKREMYQLAGLYLNNALNAYDRWGAATKVAQLRKRYFPHLQAGEDKKALTTADQSTAGAEINDLIDLETILNASRGISREIVRDNLLNLLMEIVLTNSGADKGHFLTVLGGGYRIETMDVPGKGRVDHLSVDQQAGAPLPKTLIRYVLRSKQTVLINRPGEEERYARDPYFRDHRPGSVLCMPIIRQSELIGILYLENSISRDVFNRRRIHILETLSAQIAISLENARIYRELEEMNKNLEGLVGERTRELHEINAELKLRNRELAVLSTTDQLTGLFNRRYIEQQANDAIAGCKRYGDGIALIMMDIDHFKTINDTYGHDAGDEVLVNIAALLKENIRETDIAGRWGGEEFIILFRADAGGAVANAEKLRKNIMAGDHGRAGNVTASFGVTRYLEGDSIDSLVKRADQALYRSKESGRNRVTSG